MMNEESARVFLPPCERCFERHRLAELGETVTCVHCEKDAVVKRRTTAKDAQQYWWKACETYYDHTYTLFGQHRFVLNFVHKVKDVSGDIDEFDLYDVWKADEVYVTAGEKGLEDEDGSPRKHGLSKKDAELSNQTNHQCDTRPSR